MKTGFSADHIGRGFVLSCLLKVDGPQRAWLLIQPIATLPFRLRPVRIFPPLPGSRLRFFIMMYVQHSKVDSYAYEKLIRKWTKSVFFFGNKNMSEGHLMHTVLVC